jgi:threonyl-tRNA synthetase
MPTLSLPGGETRDVPSGSPVGEVLPDDAVCARVDGELADLSFPAERDASVESVSADEADGRYVLRHSTAHVMAQAVCDLWPGARYAIGPAIEDGFYYDFELPESLAPDDLERIEARMREIVAKAQPFVREELSRGEALERFADQPFKREIVEQAEAEEGAVGDRFSVYSNNGWADLCRGPHVASTDRLGAFKLLSVAGAYWRGDEQRQQLQRVYGTAWGSQQQLDDYLVRLEEAERRDHRKLGRQLDLFSSPDELGPGLWIWHPRGGIFRKQLEDYVRDLHLDRGYDLVLTPHIARSVLWETSGHLAKYADNMYPPMRDESSDYYVKPMNCPFHILVYKSHTRSYRELPLRYAELGTIYRHERLGTLHGLLRIRGGTQDDSHIICTPDQLVDEILRVFELTQEIHATFGFSDPVVTLSLLPGESIVTPEMAELATKALRDALDRSGLPYTEAEGEGSFYGPKVDFHFRDAIGRLWQLTTVQCDFALPVRFDMEYVGEDNERHRPVMVHRAILGTLERFSAVLIEHYAGAFPLWLAPEQVRVLPIGDEASLVEYARRILEELRSNQVRAELDASSDKINGKIQRAEQMKVHTMLVIGKRDLEADAVSVRVHGKGNLGAKPRAEAISDILAAIRERRPT